MWSLLKEKTSFYTEVQGTFCDTNLVIVSQAYEALSTFTGRIAHAVYQAFNKITYN